jgi:beta-lysine 5,6-aminomutase alpha subunit
MPPTKFKTGDIFHSHVHDAMFNLVGVTTNQSIELLGMFSEAVHTPLLMDRYLSLKSARYIFGTARHLGDEIQWKPGRHRRARAREVLTSALELLEEVQRETHLGRHRARRLRRREAHPHRRQGLRGRGGAHADYLNPLLEILEKG